MRLGRCQSYWLTGWLARSQTVKDTLAHQYTRTERTTVGEYAVTIDGEKKPKPSKWFYFILKLNGVARERHNHFTNFVSTLFAQRFETKSHLSSSIQWKVQFFDIVFVV